MKRICNGKTWKIIGLVSAAFALLFLLGCTRPGETPVSVSPLTAQSPISEPVDPVSVGDQLFQAKQYEQAISAYDEAIEAGNDLARAYAGRGHAYNALRHFDEAVSDYTASLEYDRVSEVLASRCNAFRMLAETTRAIDDCNAAVELDPKNAHAHMALAALYLEQNNIDQARAEASTAQELDPESANAHYVLAQVEVVVGNLEAAAAALSKCIELDQSEIVCYWERGFIYYSLGKVDQAREDMRSVLERGDPEFDGELMYNAGKLLHTLGEDS